MNSISTESQEMRNTMKSDYGDDKLDKSNELNSSMSIVPKAPDEVTRSIKSTLNGGTE